MPRGAIMPINFAIQSIFRPRVLAKGRQGRASRFPGILRPLTTTAWVAYFQVNAARCRPVPWEQGAEVTPAQMAAIARSLQAWQLGETSDGRHLRAAAARYAARVGDPDYVRAVELFIGEEQRHGELLGRFLDLA